MNAGCVFFLVTLATESLYFAGPLVDRVLKQALWELGGHQALAYRIIHGGAADATNRKKSNKRPGVEGVVYL